MLNTTSSTKAVAKQKIAKPFPFSLKQRLSLIAEAIGVKTSLALLFVLATALTVALAEVSQP